MKTLVILGSSRELPCRYLTADALSPNWVLQLHIRQVIGMCGCTDPYCIKNEIETSILAPSDPNTRREERVSAWLDACVPVPPFAHPIALEDFI